MSAHEGIAQAVLLLDGWLDTMRGPDGYGGPVAHWWQDCMLFTGAGLDWRYEGIIAGYLNLYTKTGDERWLAKARRAGDDLLRGQLPNGNWRNSCFELNPYSGGTPHEAACDLALLHLARALRRRGDGAWLLYAQAAERNLRVYHLGQLWNADRRGFGNSPHDPTFTPNKSATIVEALFALAALQGDEELVKRWALPTLNTILQHQVVAPGRPLDGAIDQNSLGDSKAQRFFPFYVARCIPALLDGYAYTRSERYLDGAQRAMAFIRRCQLPDGSFPQVLYGDGRVNCYPQWVAGVGDILRAAHLASALGLDGALGEALRWMLAGQEAGGGIRTARGFSRRTPKPTHLPEFRDIVPVCGWVDKAFRYLTGQVSESLTLPAALSGVEFECRFRGRVVRYQEDAQAIVLWQDDAPVYRYRKGAEWAETARCRGVS